MAPELLLHGHASKASDVYAFGILLWEMVTGLRAFQGELLCVGFTAGCPSTCPVFSGRSFCVMCWFWRQLSVHMSCHQFLFTNMYSCLVARAGAGKHTMCMRHCESIASGLPVLRALLPCSQSSTGMPVALVGHHVTQLGLRPPWVSNVPPPLKQLVEDCWAQDPHDRYSTPPLCFLLCVCLHGSLPACLACIQPCCLGLRHEEQILVPACTCLWTIQDRHATSVLPYCKPTANPLQTHVLPLQAGVFHNPSAPGADAAADTRGAACRSTV
jgi:serine/threonine protein kinase